MIRTSELIELLASEARPVRRLSAPIVRASCWGIVAVAVVGLLAIGQGLRPDLFTQLGIASYAVGYAATIVTAIGAAIAAFNLAVPGRSGWWALLPLPPLLAWISATGHQCLTHWVRYDPAGMAMGDTARCFATLVLTSLPLWLLMLLMLRRSGSIRRMLPLLAGSLAVAAATATAMNLLHQLDASAMILLWNFGTGAAIMVGSTFFSQTSWTPTMALHR